MVRALGMLGLAGGFLLISPKLRFSIIDGLSEASLGLERHSPYSYVVLGVAVLGGLLIYWSKASAPR
jgi:hypothetical protein